jgi:mono/diheme cytochrome c family protein
MVTMLNPVKRNALMNPATALILGGLTMLAASALAGPDLTKLPPPASRSGVTYATDIRPLFEASCLRCHGPEKPKGGLRLDSLENVLKGSKEGKVIVPGTSEKSLLVIAVSRLDDKSAMPPKPREGRGRGGPGGAPGGAPSAPANAQSASGAPAGPGGARGPMSPLPKPLTAEQVGLVRAWVDQGAK